MNQEQARALLIVVALLMGASSSVGFVGGRVTAPVPAPAVRYVTVPAPALPEAVEPAPATAAPVIRPMEPLPAATPVEVKPPPKVESKPKEQPKPKTRPQAQKKSLPSCAFVKHQYETMSYAQQMAAYYSATPEQIAHGRHCLGM